MTRDELAQRAARHFAAGRARSVGEAIRLTLEETGTRSSAAPGHARVRRHIRGLTLQAIGQEAYEATVREAWEIAEEVMTMFEDASPVLVGRASKGQIDGGADLHVHVFTSEPLGAMADRLVERGYEEPTFDTINTRHGRLNRVSFVEGAWTVRVTRCLPGMASGPAEDLTTGKRIAAVGLRELRGRLE